MSTRVFVAGSHVDHPARRMLPPIVWPLWSLAQQTDMGVRHREDQGRDSVGTAHALERRGDRARPAEGRRGAGQDGRQRHVPQRRAPRHRRPRRSDRRAAVHRRPRGRRRGDGGRPRRVTRLAPGDHVVFGFIPACGRCPSCSTGHQNLCDLGALTASGMQITDGTSRHHAQGQDLGSMCLLGTFAHHTVVNEASCIKIDTDDPARPGLPARLRRRHRLGLGGVRGRGRSPATRSPSSASVASAPTPSRAPRWPAPRVIAAIDPVEFKREKAMEFGATHTPRRWTRRCRRIAGDHVGRDGRQGDHDDGRRLRRRARRRRSGSPPSAARSSSPTSTRRSRRRSPISLLDLTLMEKQVDRLAVRLGATRAPTSPSCSGCTARASSTSTGWSPRPTRSTGINDGYDDMRAGKNIRGVMVYE